MLNNSSRKWRYECENGYLYDTKWNLRKIWRRVKSWNSEKKKINDKKFVKVKKIVFNKKKSMNDDIIKKIIK